MFNQAINNIDQINEDLETFESLHALATKTKNTIHDFEPNFRFGPKNLSVDLSEPALAWCNYLTAIIRDDYSQKPGQTSSIGQHWAYKLLHDLDITLTTLQELKETPGFCQKSLAQLGQHQKLLRQTRRPSVYLLSAFIITICPLIGATTGLTIGAVIEAGLVDHSISAWHSPMPIFEDLYHLKLGALIGISTGFFIGLIAGIMLSWQCYQRFIYAKPEAAKLAQDFIEHAYAYIAQFSPGSVVNATAIHNNITASDSNDEENLNFSAAAFLNAAFAGSKVKYGSDKDNLA